MSSADPITADIVGAKPRRPRATFSEDFRRFFVQGLAALLPTLITIGLLFKVWEFLWESMGRHLIVVVKWIWRNLAESGILPRHAPGYIDWYFDSEMSSWKIQLLGVVLAIFLVYIVGLFVGNLIGRTLYRVAEMAVLRIPVVRAVYPAVKQVTDFILAERRGSFQQSRVVAVQPHDKGIWSIGLVTGPGPKSLSDVVGEEMVSVFVPSSPTAVTGYVLVVPRSQVVDLPLKVDDAMRLLVSGGVISADDLKDVRIVPPPAPLLDK